MVWDAVGEHAIEIDAEVAVAAARSSVKVTVP